MTGERVNILQNSATANSSGSRNLRGFLLIFGNFTRNNNNMSPLKNSSGCLEQHAIIRVLYEQLIHIHHLLPTSPFFDEGLLLRERNWYMAWLS
jgi:hypothetical protein